MNKDKAWGLFRMHLNGVLSPFAMYGMDIHIPEAKLAIENEVRELLKNLGITL